MLDSDTVGLARRHSAVHADEVISVRQCIDPTGRVILKRKHSMHLTIHLEPLLSIVLSRLKLGASPCR